MTIHTEFDIELRKNPYKGNYFALEGIDGSGKSTQVELLKKRLEKEGHEVVVTSEPRTDSLIGSFVHSILRGEHKIHYAAIQYLMSAERVTNHHDVIEPALQSGKVVLSHRCLWSNVPYGMLDRGITTYDENDVNFINITHGLMSWYHQFILPDTTFYLQIPVDAAFSRLQKMDKVKESYEKKDKMEKVAKGYEWQLQKYHSMFTVIDGQQDEKKVTEDILEKIKEFVK